MVEVGDKFESDVATYEVVKETKCKFVIKRINKKNHPTGYREFPLNYVWKKCFNVSRLKKI